MAHEFDFYLPKVWPSWKEELLRMFSDGMTNVEVCAEIMRHSGKGFSLMTFHKWQDAIPEFKDVVRNGQLAKKAWWFKKGRENIDNNKFNTSLYVKMMGNLFAFKSEVNLETEGASTAAKVDMSKWSTEDIEAYVKLVKKAKEKETAAKEKADNVINGRFGTGTDD